MHELTIAQNIIDIVIHSIPRAEFHNAESVKIKLGLFNDIIPEVLTTSFDILKKQNELDNTNLEIDIIPLIIKCNNCMQTISAAEPILSCYYCNSDDLRILNGDVLELSEILLSDDA